jgi:isopentenyl-diphosphate delta-isomerase
MDGDHVILVDENDRPRGSAPKLDVHRTGSLHRAFSVFVFDHEGRTLLQQRASGKYHSGGRWSNAACGHPRPGEETGAAARRRLGEELGIDCALAPAGTFTYRATVAPSLVEHEIDHVFVGQCAQALHPDAREVTATRWIEIDALRKECRAQPERFTVWFLQALEVALRSKP